MAESFKFKKELKAQTVLTKLIIWQKQ